MKRLIHSSPATIIALVALFFSLGGVGMAATGYRITNIWQIAPKVRHQLRSAQGPIGPSGPRGATGATGAPGTPGTPGTVAPTIGAVFGEGPKVTLAPGESTDTVAICPSKPAPFYFVTSAGGYFGDAGIQVFTNATDSVTGWVVGAYNPTSQPLTVQAWVTCIASSAPPAYASMSPNLRHRVAYAKR